MSMGLFMAGCMADSSQGWAEVSRSVVGVGNALRIAAMGPALIALLDNDNEEIRTYEYGGGAWTQVGNTYPFAVAGIGTDLTALGTSTIAVSSTGQPGSLRTLSWDGSDWALLGNVFTSADIFITNSLTRLSNASVALLEPSGSDPSIITKYSFDGTNWSKVGDTSSVGTGRVASAAALNENTVAIAGDDANELETYSFDGSDWNLIDSITIPHASFGNNLMSDLSPTQVIQRGSFGSSELMYVYRWNGSEMTPEGGTYMLTPPDSWAGAISSAAALTAYSTAALIQDGTTSTYIANFQRI